MTGDTIQRRFTVAMMRTLTSEMPVQRRQGEERFEAVEQQNTVRYQQGEEMLCRDGIFVTTTLWIESKAEKENCMFYV